MAAVLTYFNKEEEVRIKVDIKKSLHDELIMYTKYLGGDEDDISETIIKSIQYVLDRESKGKQGKKYKEFKDKFLNKQDI